MTEEQMREMLEQSGKGFVYDPLLFDCANTVTVRVALEAMRRAFELGRTDAVAEMEAAGIRLLV